MPADKGDEVIVATVTGVVESDVEEHRSQKLALKDLADVPFESRTKAADRAPAEAIAWSFGISNDIAMQVVGVGFIIGVLQDSCETALNSSSDVLFTATAEFAERAKEGSLTAEDMVPSSKG